MTRLFRAVLALAALGTLLYTVGAPHISGAVARLCYENPGLRPRAALNRLLAGRSSLPGHGRVRRLLPGTPVS